MLRRNWTDSENDLIVADYFAMLSDELAGRPYNKAKHNRELRPSLNGRNKKAVEFKYCNISAALQKIGEKWIKGYWPLGRYQSSLVDAVERWLESHPEWVEQSPYTPPHNLSDPTGKLEVGRAPTQSNTPPPKEMEQLQRVARKLDIPGRDARNRALGEEGEKCALAHEEATLKAHNRHDLAEKVRWVSKLDGDGVGYDIASYTPEGRSRLIEVKTTNGWERTPFYITRNELEVSKERPSEWCLFRLWDFSNEPKAFELHPPLDSHVSLVATSYRANFNGVEGEVID